MKTNCGSCLLIFLIGGVMGAFVTKYSIHVWFGKTVEFLPAMIAGFFLWEISLPAAILGWLLTSCGVHMPIFELK